MASTLPEPGGEAELRRFVGELLSEPLDSSRPLWDAWFVEGVDDDRVAFVLRVHHVLADGLSLFDAAMLLMDLEPRDDPDVGAVETGAIPRERPATGRGTHGPRPTPG